jgi:hypothetical protein
MQEKRGKETYRWQKPKRQSTGSASPFRLITNLSQHVGFVKHRMAHGEQRKLCLLCDGHVEKKNPQLGYIDMSRAYLDDILCFVNQVVGNILPGLDSVLDLSLSTETK